MYPSIGLILMFVAMASSGQTTSSEYQPGTIAAVK